jgi:DNA repair protein RAD50
MAQIHKLKIQGIRSFGPDDANAQSITFTTPITCIVGQNGCGKTVRNFV